MFSSADGTSANQRDGRVFRGLVGLEASAFLDGFRHQVGARDRRHPVGVFGCAIRYFTLRTKRNCAPVGRSVTAFHSLRSLRSLRLKNFRLTAMQARSPAVDEDVDPPKRLLLLWYKPEGAPVLLVQRERVVRGGRVGVDG